MAGTMRIAAAQESKLHALPHREVALSKQSMILIHLYELKRWTLNAKVWLTMVPGGSRKGLQIGNHSDADGISKENSESNQKSPNTRLEWWYMGS